MLTNYLIATLIVIVAYFLGSIPTGYLAGRWLQGIDIREHGSKSIGATNVLRILGKRAAIAVLTVDLLKGVLATALVNTLAIFSPSMIPVNWQPWLIILAAFAAVLAHSRSIWLNFTGGKSVAVGLGTLFVMNPLIALGTLGTFALFLAVGRIVSLSSIAGAIAVNLMMLLLGQPLPYQLFTGVAGLYVILRHRGNIVRLLAGTEPKIGQQVPSEEATEVAL